MVQNINDNHNYQTSSEYFHEALSSPEPDELPESLQGPDLDRFLRDKEHIVLRQEDGPPS